MQFNILEPTVYFCLVPLMYLAIIFFAVLLIARTQTWDLRARCILGGFGGLLFALVFIILDVTTTGIAGIPVDPKNTIVVAAFGILGVFMGFILLLLIDVLLQRGAVSFVVLFLMWASAVSAYFLITASRMRSVISVTTIMFILGNIIYIMMNFKLISRALGINKKEESTSSDRWKL